MDYKKHINSLLCVVASFTLMGCPSDSVTSPSEIIIDKKPHQLSIGATSISLGANSNLSKDISVTSDNTGWEFLNVPTTWLSVSPSNGKASTTVRLTATENTSVDETRTQVMQFRSTEPDYTYSRDISVSQATATVYINPKETSYGCEAAANSKTIGIDSNVEWEATCAEQWLTLTKGNSQLTIAATENLGASRSATILLKRSGTTTTVSTISVTQSEANVTGSTETLNFNVNGESRQVSITAGASWTAYTSDPSWISVTPESGKDGSATLTISVTANASSNTRSGFVYVKIGDNTKLSIPVQQDNMSISSEGTLPVLDGEGTRTYPINVVSTSPWIVTSKSDWLKVSPDKGEAGTTSVSVSADKNPSIHARNGSLEFGIPQTSIKAKVDVEQAGVGMGADALNFSWSGSSQTLGLSAPNTWNAMVSTDWISLSQYSGTGSTDVTVSVTTNDSEDERNGMINIVTEGETKGIKVHQEGQYLKIGGTAGTVSAMGGSVMIAVNTTVGAQGSLAYSGNMKDWIQVSNNTSNNYTLIVSANPSQYSRNAVFTIKPTMATTNQSSSAGVKYTINQKGRILSTNVSKIEFFSKGGSSSVYTIQADGTYSIQKGSMDSWYVLLPDETANTFYIVASENDTNSKREGLLTLSLRNMPDGENYSIEIPIIQFPSNPLIEGFGEDQNWNQ